MLLIEIAQIFVAVFVYGDGTVLENGRHLALFGRRVIVGDDVLISIVELIRERALFVSVGKVEILIGVALAEDVRSRK